MIYEVYKAMRFTRRERPEIAAATSSQALVDIVERAKQNNVKLHFVSLGVSLALILGGVISLLLMSTVPDGSVAMGVLFWIAFSGAASGISLLVVTSRINRFKRSLLVKSSDLISGFKGYEGDLNRLIDTLCTDVSDLRRSPKSSKHLSYCKSNVSHQSYHYYIFRYHWSTGNNNESNNNTYWRNGIWCDVPGIAPLDIWNNEEAGHAGGKKRWWWQTHSAEHHIGQKFLEYFTIIDGDESTLESFLTDAVQKVLINLARQYEYVNIQVTSDEKLYITWQGNDPFDNAVNSSSNFDQYPWCDASYDHLIEDLNTPITYAGPERMLAAIQELREHLALEVEPSPLVNKVG